jgi:hypothetical protein
VNKYPNLIVRTENAWAICLDDSSIVKTLRLGEILEFVRVTQVAVRDANGESLEVRYTDVSKTEI